MIGKISKIFKKRSKNSKGYNVSWGENTFYGPEDSIVLRIKNEK